MVSATEETDLSTVAPLPRRWLVLGPGGAGKTRFSLALGAALGLPVVHLDRHFWGAGWVEPPRDEWNRRVARLSEEEAWVMDGNYSGSLSVRLSRAQAAVLLDPPVWQCVAGIYARGLRHRGRVRPDLSEGCEERLPTLDFVRYVASYRRRSLPRVLARLGAAPHVELHHLRSRRAARSFLDQWAANVAEET